MRVSVRGVDCTGNRLCIVRAINEWRSDRVCDEQHWCTTIMKRTNAYPLFFSSTAVSQPLVIVRCQLPLLTGWAC